jgi:hypothetical protein
MFVDLSFLKKPNQSCTDTGWRQMAQKCINYPSPNAVSKYGVEDNYLYMETIFLNAENARYEIFPMYPLNSRRLFYIFQN